MITSSGMSKVASLYENAAGMQKKNAVSLNDREKTEAEKAVEKKAAQIAEKNAERKKAAEKLATETKISSSEDKLSDRAKEYLNKLNPQACLHFKKEFAEQKFLFPMLFAEQKNLPNITYQMPRHI